ncbi:MAG: ParB/RepB/Spo0J family partition protein [Elusimicrobia bacterium]|nr:ParB/RepB/Spo0J family partition protein [Elusimicrobiota bacterium]
MVSRLGRGLDALLPMKTDGFKTGNSIADIPVEKISSGQFQARTIFDQVELQSLADSIKAFGLLEPVLVSQRPAGGYALIAGERRLRAVKLAGLKTISAIVKSFGVKETAIMGLIENVQRKDLNPVDLAKGVERMAEEFHLTHEEIASSLGMSRPRITNLLRLLQLAPQIQEYLMNNHLSEGQARALLSLDRDEERLRLAKEIAEGARSWSVREIERKKKIKAKDPNVVALEEELEKLLSAKVRISMHSKKKAGWISIHFGNLDHFESLFGRMKGEGAL